MARRADSRPWHTCKTVILVREEKRTVPFPLPRLSPCRFQAVAHLTCPFAISRTELTPASSLQPLSGKALFDHRDNQLHRLFHAQVFQIDHQVIQMRIGDVTAKMLAHEITPFAVFLLQIPACAVVIEPSRRMTRSSRMFSGAMTWTAKPRSRGRKN